MNRTQSWNYWKVLHSRPAAPDRRLDVMRQVCDGRLAAHERGVVHGAIKPSHVFIQSDGIAKLLDFGSDERSGPYTSPEQMTGKVATERSDVSSAGATFHLMLSDDTPDALRNTVRKAVQTGPQRRHGGVAHLRAEIDQLRHGRQGDGQRVMTAAFDRYRDIESLLAQRRAHGRQLGLSAIEHECDATLARRTADCPEFARAGLDLSYVGDIDASGASDVLIQLQLFHYVDKVGPFTDMPSGDAADTCFGAIEPTMILEPTVVVDTAVPKKRSS